jgi:hypothetical protein
MRISLLAFVAVLTGCGVAAAPQPLSPPVEQSANVAIAPAGGTVTFPSVGGFGGTFVYSANNATAGMATATITTIDGTAASLIPGQLPPGKMLAAFEFELNQSVTFIDWYRLLTTITIPSSITPGGHTFSEYGYDLKNAVAEGSNPGIINGWTISFAPGPGPVTLLANHTYLLVLSMQ